MVFVVHSSALVVGAVSSILESVDSLIAVFVEFICTFFRLLLDLRLLFFLVTDTGQGKICSGVTFSSSLTSLLSGLLPPPRERRRLFAFPVEFPPPPRPERDDVDGEMMSVC